MYFMLKESVQFVLSKKKMFKTLYFRRLEVLRIEHELVQRLHLMTG